MLFTDVQLVLFIINFYSKFQTQPKPLKLKWEIHKKHPSKKALMKDTLQAEKIKK